MSRNLGALTLLDPSWPAWPVMGVLYLYLTYSNMPVRNMQSQSVDNERSLKPDCNIRIVNIKYHQLKTTLNNFQ
jgi:hypothetical protein